MATQGYEVPAGNGLPAMFIETPEELARAGYTAVAPEVLEEAFGENGLSRFLAAVANTLAVRG